MSVMSSCRTGRVVLIALIVAMVAATVACRIPAIGDWTAGALCMSPSTMLSHWAFWQPLTAIFVQGALMQLLFHSLVVFFLGRSFLSGGWSGLEFGGFFLWSGGVGFAVAGLVCSGLSLHVRLCGAQGALAGLVGAWLLMRWRSSVRIFTIQIPARLLYALLMVVLAVQAWVGGPRAWPGLLGAIAGSLLLGVVWMRHRAMAGHAADHNSSRVRLQNLEVFRD